MSSNNKTDYQIAQQQIFDGIISGEFDIENRKDLGPMIPIRLFQALRMVALGSNVEEILGQGAPSLIYHSGQSLGLAMGQIAVANIDKDLETYVGKIKLLCRQLSIGLVVPEKVDLSEGLLELRVDECVSCAGIHHVAAPICHFEAGMVGGIVKTFFKRNVKATETKCNALGDKTCLIRVDLL
ncbi:V4R domain-containing protein [Methylomonas rapida]|uniref:4-vinyl reductase n=1 Tax=Methylomonas rapida TaxID=2963939 RepID=A0ABY7GGE5_9GAMM|nr:V4R domain-containing protein [Methylomonas rapida]WAR43894.1 4-vinyl reductase [Methylomonas rapida]